VKKTLEQHGKIKGVVEIASEWSKVILISKLVLCQIRLAYKTVAPLVVLHLNKEAGFVTYLQEKFL
jgi:hypothetical protein